MKINLIMSDWETSPGQCGCYTSAPSEHNKRQRRREKVHKKYLDKSLATPGSVYAERFEERDHEGRIEYRKICEIDIPA